MPNTHLVNIYIPTMEPINLSLYEATPIKAPTDTNVLQYAGGILDMDGAFFVSVKQTPCISISRTDKSFTLLKFMYDNFGGRIKLLTEASGNQSARYIWSTCSLTDAISLARTLEPNLLIKRREALAMAELPDADTSSIQLSVVAEDGGVRTFETVKDARDALGCKFAFTKTTVAVEVIGGDAAKYTVMRRFNPDAVRARKGEIEQLVKAYHKAEHDSLEHITGLTDAYMAGVIDGGSLQVSGSCNQTIVVSMKWKQLPELLQRLFGGTLAECKVNNKWSICSRYGSRQLLERVAQYVVSKKKQVELILGMEAGDAGKVHAELNALKERNKAIAQPAAKTRTRLLPTGVYPYHQNRFEARFQRNGLSYKLGIFATSDEASARYQHILSRHLEEKRTGAKLMDWETLKDL